MSDRKKDILSRLGAPGIVAIVREFRPDAKSVGENQFQVRCPFHDDTNASGSINTILGVYNCFACGAAGGFVDWFMKAAGYDFKTALNELAVRAGMMPASTTTGAKLRPSPAPKNSSTGKSAAKSSVRSKVVATFKYHDAAGTVAYYKKRFEPSLDGKKNKSFLFFHKDRFGKEVANRGCEPLLYNAHLLANNPPGQPVFVLEGEGKADALTAWGLVATTLDSGGQSGKSKSSWREEFNRFFEGRDVYILPDNDKTGETYAETIALKISKVAASVRLLRLPGLPVKGDLLDWIKINTK